MLRAVPRPLVLVLATCIAFVSGVAYEHFGRDAQAQSAGVSTLYVPQGGLVFRSVDGAPLARISGGAQGGVVEVYDARHQIASRLTAASPVRPALVDDNPYAGPESGVDRPGPTAQR